MPIASFALGLLVLLQISQQPRVRHLPEPTARSVHGYTYITGVRELRDRRVIVVDADEQAVYVVASDLSRHYQIGRTGSRPGEYRLPSRILPLSGDSTGILDESRVLIITPDAQIGESILLPSASPALDTPWAGSSPPQATDGSARFYALASPIVPGPGGAWRATDSAAIIRWRSERDVDTAAFVPANVRGAQLIGRMVATPPRGPFAAAPTWAIAPDGRVAVVHPDPYHVIFYHSRRRTTIGPSIPYRRIEIADDYKEVWRVDQQRPRPLTIRQRGETGTAIVRMSPPYREPDAWPEHLPPFLAEGAIFAPDGRLWVQRTQAPSEGSSWDIFDEAGRIIETVRAAPNSRLAGFGVNALYIIRRNVDDV
jgi:hypothetical protein